MKFVYEFSWRVRLIQTRVEVSIQKNIVIQIFILDIINVDHYVMIKVSQSEEDFKNYTITRMFN